LKNEDQENCSSRPTLAKSQQDSISTNQPDMVVCIYNPSYVGGLRRRIVFGGQPGQKLETLLEK
jgi:hypothetical protein